MDGTFISRRLQETPAYADFIVIAGLVLLCYLLMKGLLAMSASWKRMMIARIKAAEKKRKGLKDPFRADNGYSWDFVMIFNVLGLKDTETPKQMKYSLKFILSQLADAGLETKLFYSVRCNKVYCKIRCPIRRLYAEADRIGYKLLLDSTSVANCLAEGKRGPMKKTKDGDEETWKWFPVSIPDNELLTSIAPYDFIYAEFKNEASKRYLYKKYDNGTLFRGVDRLKIIYNIIESRKCDGGANLDIFKLKTYRCIDSFFPLHDYVELRSLEERWLRMCQSPWKQHIDVAKDYFGEKIGLYFLFLGHFTSWLMGAAVIGFFCWIDVAADDNNPNARSMPYFATFMALWSSFFLEYWKRKEKSHAMKWGMVGFEDEEGTRPQFNGVDAYNPVNGKTYLYFSGWEAFRRILVTSTFVGSLILVVIGVIATIFLMRIELSKLPSMTINGIALAGIIASVVNALQIQVFNALYGSFAIWCTDFENHRTDTHYEDALIAKTFVFQFVNSFASLFYTAFVKPYIPQYDPCNGGNCMKELQVTLGTIFLTRLTVGNFTAVAVPSITRRMNDRTIKDFKDVSDIEYASMRGTYDVMLGTFTDYANLIILYGYTTMFVCAFPLAVVNAFINNYASLRIDAWKLCQEFRRPEPRSQEDIGTWYIILEIVSGMAVLTNAGLVAFTGNQLFDYTWTWRAWIFIIMASGILSVKYLIAISVPDIPLDVDIQLQRQEFIVAKVIFDAADDQDDEVDTKIKSQVDYTIRVTDDDPL